MKARSLAPFLGLVNCEEVSSGGALGRMNCEDVSSGGALVARKVRTRCTLALPEGALVRARSHAALIGAP